MLFENYSHSLSALSSKNNRAYSKDLAKEHVCNHEIIRLIMMKMKMKKKIRSRRYDIDKLRSRHGHKYSKYKKCLIMMMLLRIKQHLSNFGSSIHEEVKHHRGRLEKKRCLY